MTTVWDPLIAALDNWEEEGRVARFWLRDDDAVEPTPELRQLLDLCEHHDIPITLAVIPAHAKQALASLVAARRGIQVTLHGWSHENHAPFDQKKQELGSHRPADVVLGELAAGTARLSDLFGAVFVPVLVPPWNRIDKALLPQLGNAGIRGLSVFGHEQVASLPMVNTHVDIMDWHGSRGCRPFENIVDDVLIRLDEMKKSGGSMGLLTHHLVHDAAAWDFLRGFFEATTRHPACRWCVIGGLFNPLPA